MNCRAMRALGVTAALMLAGIGMTPAARAQAASTPAATTTEAPAAVYGKLLKMMSDQIIGAAEAMPADKYDFVPRNGSFAGVRSFGDQVKHLTGANYGFFSGFGVAGAPDRKAMAGLKGKDQIVQALKDSYAYAEKSIDTMTPGNAFEQVSFGPEKITRAGAATFALAHSMDHYGQMVEYLRMNGIVPPASRKK